MSITAFLLIVASAVLHATWNLIAKKNTMTLALYAALATCGFFLWSNVLFWTPVSILSLPLKFWLCLAGSVCTDVFLYAFGLVRIYRTMDMASAYPMMRALPILFIAVLTSLLGLGAPINCISAFGFLLVFIGSFMMPLNKFSDFKVSKYASFSTIYIIIAAMGTTGYTVFDSQAMAALRASCADMGFSTFIISITYYSIRVALLTTVLYIVVLSIKSERKNLIDYWKTKNFSPLLAGGCATMTYVLVLIAMNYVTNVSYVQVCRQIGLPIGMAAGIIFLKEKNALVKWIGVTLILSGLTISLLS